MFMCRRSLKLNFFVVKSDILCFVFVDINILVISSEVGRTVYHVSFACNILYSCILLKYTKMNLYLSRFAFEALDVDIC